MSSPVSRRTLLRGLAALPVAGLAAAACGRGMPTAADLLAEPSFFIAHRGAGDEAPEHTMEAYTRIVERGAAAVEISVHRTADGVLVCHHDPTLERTCNGDQSAIKDLTFAELQSRQIDMRRTVGPAWGTQAIPRFETVLDAIGGKAVLFVEPKADEAALDVLRVLVDRKLQSTTVYKQYYTSTGDDAARAAGLKVWNYVDATASVPDVAALVHRSDAIGVAADHDPLDDPQAQLVRAAVATRKPVIGYALSRRHQVTDLAAMGVRGFMASSWSYLTGDSATANRDGFRAGRVQPGDLPGHDDDAALPLWNPDGTISLADPTRPQSLMMGSMCPLPQEYTLSAGLQFDGAPTQAQHAGLVVGCYADNPYRYGAPSPAYGFLTILRGNGSVEIRSVTDDGAGDLLASAPGPAITPGGWEDLDVQLRSGQITVTRQGVTPVTASAFVPSSGRYFGLTRDFGSSTTAVRYRNVTVSTPA